MEEGTECYNGLSGMLGREPFLGILSCSILAYTNIE